MIRLTPHGPVVNVTSGELFAKVRKDLTQTIEVGHPSRRHRTCVSFYARDGNLLRIPLAYATTRQQVTDERTQNHRFDHEFHGVLRPAQRSICEATLEQLLSESCATLVMPTGSGKTVCALAIAARLALKPIVLVHKTFLGEQWKSRILQYFGPGISVSTVQGNVGDFSGDIVIGIIQTFVSRQLSIPSCCGLVIVDEAHHIAANQFKHVILKGITSQRHILALSATPRRHDGLDIQPLVGAIVSAPTNGLPTLPRSICGSVDHANVMVKIMTFTSSLFQEQAPLTSNGDVSYTGMVSKLVELSERTEYISNAVVSESDGRDTLVLSHRRQHCMDIVERLQKRGLDVALYIPNGKRPPPLPTAKVVVSTFAFVSEGFDMPRLSCVVFATPASNLEQAVGRITRTPNPTMTPLVIDVADTWGLLNASTRKRKTFYHAAGYVVATKHGQVRSPPPSASPITFIEED